jgi:hypothetical protein
MDQLLAQQTPLIHFQDQTREPLATTMKYFEHKDINHNMSVRWQKESTIIL